MTPESLEGVLCRTFCEGLSVRAVPVGLAISGAFRDTSGDPIEFFLIEAEDGGFRLEDDGSYLAHLIAQDIPIDQGQRGQLLRSILAQGGAFYDPDSLEIRTDRFEPTEAASRSIAFLSSLIRVRDLQLLTRETVRSTFREDAVRAMQALMGGVANINEDEPFDRQFADFPADVVIHPKVEGALGGMIYLVSSNEKLAEAQLAQNEARELNRDDLKVIALVEDLDLKQISRKKFQRAQNRGLIMPIFRGDEDASMRRIAQDLRLTRAIGN